MPFFKIDGKDLISGPQIHGPGFSLMEELKDSYVYPVQGWHWFVSAEEAASVLVLKKPTVTTVSMRQCQLALYERGLLDTVEQVIASLGREAQINWNTGPDVERTNPLLIYITKTLLGWTDEMVDDLFALALTK